MPVYPGAPPHFFPSWLSKSTRMVSRPTRGTSLRLITSSVNSRTVQRARPSGGGEQTTAMMRCLTRHQRQLNNPTLLRYRPTYPRNRCSHAPIVMTRPQSCPEGKTRRLPASSRANENVAQPTLDNLQTTRLARLPHTQLLSDRRLFAPRQWLPFASPLTESGRLAHRRTQ